jgi:Flp pilus assembly protein TadB
MEEFNDLKNIWKEQKVSEMDYEEFLKKANSFSQKEKRKVFFTNLSLGLTSIFILCIWWYYQPEYITTKVGIILSILTMVFFILYLNKTNKILEHSPKNFTSKVYLEKLLAFQKKQRIIQSRGMNLYLIFLFLGIALYMYEYTSRMSLTAATITYGIVTVWFLLNWLYLKPRIVRKQRKKLDNLIEALQQITKQLK